jgi:hypothetical protein
VAGHGWMNVAIGSQLGSQLGSLATMPTTKLKSFTPHRGRNQPREPTSALVCEPAVEHERQSRAVKTGHRGRWRCQPIRKVGINHGT